MAITLVGTVTHVTAASATPDEVSLPMGVAEGDIVLAACATDSASVFPNPSDGSSDYTTIFNTNNIVAYGAFYKVQGATPDSTIFLPGWRETGDFPTPWVVVVFRGVDVTTPLDQTSVADTGSGQPNPDTITTVTDGAAVVSFGMLDDDNITSCTQSGATDVAFIGGGASSNTSSIMFGWQTQATAGAVDPAAFSTDGTDAWAAVTLALKPAAEGGGGDEGVGAATAATVASGTSAALKSSPGSASSTVNVSATSTALKEAAGSSSAAVTVLAEGVSAIAAVGSASGAATATGVGISQHEATASASVATTAAATSQALKAAAGSASATVAVDGVGSSTSDSGIAVGTASAVVSVNGVGTSTASIEAAGAVTVTTTVEGIGLALGLVPEQAGGGSAATDRDIALLLAKYANLKQQDRNERNEKAWREALDEFTEIERGKRSKLLDATKEAIYGKPVAVPAKPQQRPLTPKRAKSKGRNIAFDFKAAEANMAAMEYTIQALGQRLAEHEERQQEEDDVEILFLLVA